MKFHLPYCLVFIVLFILDDNIVKTQESTFGECHRNHDDFMETVKFLTKSIVPSLEGTNKGDSGRIGIIGGSIEYCGAPYFSAISALKIGADLVYVITTEDAAPIIKAYSPDLIVYPFLSKKHASKISALLPKMDAIIIGPGLGREEESMKLTYEIIDSCKFLKKPLVIDADGLYAVSKNVSILNGYPSPGVILTPNGREAKKIIEAVGRNDTKWCNFWGDHVSVLIKGAIDQYYSSNTLYNWASSEGGSGRRAGGQGDILSGALGTLYTWAIRSKMCDNNLQLAQSVATYAAAKFTRECNAQAFKTFGRSLLASDMIKYIHVAFETIFNYH
ncbi:hypothetical protein O3G_MSEX009610 [Manduca sexta]|uniref:ATP-dependent (S)-NAD(P)H-hydrate dehydratase n=1 Tax=Manduca sexta TaxID=7130 RepID=A0A921ZE79_MANSE|nr:hypothetical protein O3G_MSEX009610 [Manduca sexta]